MLPFPVEIKIKFRNLLYKFPCFLVQTAHILQQIRREHNLSRHIQPHHMDFLAILMECLIYQGSAVRVTPIIVFCNRWTVSMTFKAAAHGNNLLNTGKCFFILLDQSGKIGHRCQFDYGYFLFFQYISKKIHSTDLLLITDYFLQKAFAKSIFSVSVQSIHIIPP